MKTTISILISVLFLSLSSFSQIEERGARKNPKPSFEHNKDSKHALGIAAGFTTGVGLSYLYMPDRLCFQATFLPYKDQYNTLISAGLTFIYRLREGEKLNFLMYQGNHLRYREETNYYYPNPAGTKTSSIGFNNGIGLGFEFFLSTNVSFNFMGGYAGYNNFETITLTGETALFYKF